MESEGSGGSIAETAPETVADSAFEENETVLQFFYTPILPQASIMNVPMVYIHMYMCEVGCRIGS